MLINIVVNIRFKSKKSADQTSCIALIDIFWRLEDAGVPEDLDPPRFGPPVQNR